MPRTVDTQTQRENNEAGSFLRVRVNGLRRRTLGCRGKASFNTRVEALCTICTGLWLSFQLLQLEL